MFIGGSLGTPGKCTPNPLGPISLIFMQFSFKKLPNNRLAPLPLGLVPRLEILDSPPILLQMNSLIINIKQICIILNKNSIT